MVIHYTECIFLQELMEKLKIPSDADLMKIVVDDLKNSSISLEDRQHALQELLILVEPIDSGNGKSAPFLVHLYATYYSSYQPKYLLISTEN
jgi:hypothetical protein